MPISAKAQTEPPQFMTVDGRLYDSTTPEDPLLDNSVLMKIQVLNPAKTCILYEEEQTVSTLSSNGYFNVRVGSPTSGAESLKRTTNDSGNSMMAVFQNQNASITGRTSGGGACSYTPAAGDTRYFRYIVTPSTTGVTSTLSPDMQIDSVPQALVAETLQGMSPDDFVQINSDVTQAKANALFGGSYTTLTGLLAGTSSLYLRNTTNGTVIPSRATDPLTPSAGQIWYDSDDNVLRYYDGTVVQTLSSGTADPTKLPLAGGSMAGAIDMATNDITDIGHMTQAPQRTFRFGVYTTAQQTSLIATPLIAGHEGTVWYNTTTNKLMFWDGTAEYAVSPVDSVFGRTGAVVAVAGDYTATQITNTAAGNIAATDAQAAINELDTEKVAKAGDTMTGALNIDNEQELRLSEADGSGANYVAIKSPTTLSADYTLTLPTTDGDSGQVLTTDGSGVLSWTSLAAVGETNTASNQGAGGVGLYDAKSGVDLQFRNINAASNKISVALDAGNKEVDLNVNEANLDTSVIPNTAAGTISSTNTQAAINELDTEKVATTRAINTTAGSGLAGGGDLSADRSLSVDINGTTAETAVAGADEILIYDASASALRKMTRTNFVLSETEVDAMVGNNGYLTAEADTLATVTGRGASTATNITMNTQAQTRYADSAGGEYAAIQAPATIASNYVLTLPTTDGDSGQVLTTDGSGVLTWTSLAAVGETNTASNQGAGGVGLYDTKSGVDLQFRNINAASNKVSVALDAGNKEVDINVNEANLDSGVIPNTAAGNIAATNVQAAINELDTEKVAKAGDTMTGSLNIDNEQELRLSEADGSGANYVAIKSLTTLAANYTLTLPATDGDSGQVLTTDGSGVLSWTSLAAVGETNTASNQGAGGVGLYDAKSGVDLQFRNINAASNKISVALDAGNKEVDLNVNEANLDTSVIPNTAAGTISATNTQAAINELDTEKVATTRAINTAAGSGLSGGGDLSADRSLSVNINGMTAETAVAGADEILIYDASASALRKMTRTNFVLSETEVDAMVSNNGYLTSEADTLATVTGRGASTATNITMNTQAQTRYADSAGGEYAAIQAPATIASNYVLTLPTTDGDSGQVLTTDGSGVLTWTSLAAVGETNTASNQGAGGVGLYDAKSGVDLQFRNINAASNKISVALDAGNKEVDINVNEANLDTAVIPNTAAGNIAATNVQAAINELDAEKVAKSGDTMTGALNIDNEQELRLSEADGSGANYVAIKALTTLGANYTLTLPPDDGTSGQYLQTDGNGVLTWVTPAGVGETNTASNQGVGGVGVFKQKTTYDLEFRNINAASNKISVALDAGNNEIDINVAEANLDTSVIPNTAAGNIAATNTQAAINELDTEKVATTRAINTTVGSGLSGGGDLSADRSLSVNINGTTAETAVAGADEILIYDASASALRKMTRTNFVLSETEVDAMVSNNGYLTSEADTLATVTGRGAVTATNITMNTQAQTRYADSAGGEYAAIQAPATIASNYILTLPTTDGDSGQVLTTDGSGVLTWTSLAAVGETNTASNQGAGGVGLYDAKSGVDLQFRNINAASNKVSVALDAGNKEVDINVNEANLDSGVIPNTAAGNITATNVQAAINELDTEKVAKSGDTMTGALNIDNEQELRLSEADGSGANYVAIKALTTLGANYTLTLPPDDGTSGQYLQTDGNGVLTWVTPAGVGETNTASNQGVGGVGVFKQKTTYDLEFRNINAASNKISVTLDAGNNEIDINVAEANLDTSVIPNTAAGNIAATNTQAAINELDTEKVATTRAINTAAGSGLIGGGDLSADRSLSVNINGTTAETAVAGTDEILIYDTSASALRKMTRTNFVLSETEVDAMVSNNGFLSSEADTLATVTGRGASTATSITMSTQAQTRYADAAGGEYAAIQAPATIGANYVLTLPTSAGSANQVLTTDGTGVLSWTTPSTTPGADTLDFTHFADAMTLDASTDISVTGTNVLSVTNSGTGNSFVVNDQAADTSPFVIDASGNLGVGTTAPLTLMHARGAQNAGIGIAIENTTTGTTAAAAISLSSTTSSGTLAQISSGFTTSGMRKADRLNLEAGGAGSGLTLNTVGADPIEFGTNDTSRMIIDSNGNVGIGTTSPTSGLLHIESTAPQIYVNSTTNTGWAGVTLNIPSTATTGGGSFEVTKNGTAVMDFGFNDNTNLTYFDSTSLPMAFLFSGTERMRLLNTGNLGIGTTVPGTLLDVAGAITARPHGTATGETGKLILRELAAGGTDTATIRAPDAITTSYSLTLPDTAGAPNQVLTTDGAGLLSWSTPSATPGADSLDFTHFADAMTLDASTDISVTGTNVLSVTNSGTGNSFVVNDQAADTSPFVIDASGNVGVGTATPLSTLHINGGVGSLSTGLSFGDGDSGIFENTDDNLRFQLLGVDRWFMNTSSFHSQSGSGPQLYAGGADNAAVRPRYNEDSGLGWISVGKISISTSVADNLMTFDSTLVGIGTTVPGTLLDVAGAITARPHGTATGETGKLILRELAAGGTETATIRAPDAITTSYSLTLPSTSGAANQVLTTDGTGVLSWVDSSTALPSQTGNSGKFLTTNGAAASWGSVSELADGDNNTKLYVDKGALNDNQIRVDMNGSNEVFTLSGTGGATATNSMTMSIKNGSSGNSNYLRFMHQAGGIYGYVGYDGSRMNLRSESSLSIQTNGTNERLRVSSTGEVGIGTTVPGTLLDVAGAITARPFGTATGETGQLIMRELAAGGTDTVAIRAPDAIATSYSLTLPGTAGAANQVLTTNGSGVLSWTTPGGTVADDSLNFDKFSDTMSLDASTDIAASGTNVLSITNSGTGNSFVVNDQASDTSPFVIDASGNVGIGTTTPSTTLTIERPDPGQSDMLTLSNPTAYSWGLGGKMKFQGVGNREMASLKSYWDMDTTGTYFTIDVRRSDSMTNGIMIDQWGPFSHPHVSIGGYPAGGRPTSPRFSVYSESTGGNSVVNALMLHHVDSDSAASSGIGNSINFVTESNSSNIHVETAAITSTLVDATNNSKDGMLSFSTLGPNATAGSNSATERMRIDSSGNVGIGTTVPGTLLDVAGAITSRPFGTGTGQTGQLIMRELAAGGTDTVAIRAPDAITTSYSLTLPNTAGAANQVLTTNGSGVLSWTTPSGGTVADDSLNFDKFSDTMSLDASTDIAASGTNVLSITNSGTGNSFVVNDQASDTSPFVIDASGNVGIGTTTAGYKLDVFGSVNIGSTNTYNINGNSVIAFYDTGPGFDNMYLGVYTTPLGIASGSVANTAVGIDAGRSITTGSHNTVGGFSAGGDLNTGSDNTFFGSFAAWQTQNGNYNTVFGRYSNSSLTSGSSNTTVGHRAMMNNTTGDNNTAIGNEAMGTEGGTAGDMDSNTVVGYQAGYSFAGGTSGLGPNNNILFGYRAGDNITTGDQNLLIGYDIDAPTATTSNFMSIGNLIFSANVNGTGTTVSSGNVGIATATPDSKLSVVAGSGEQAPGANATGTVLHVSGADAAMSRVLVDSFGTGSQSVVTLRSARGTRASPTAVQSADAIGTFGAQGYGASAYGGTMGSIVFAAAENWTNTAQGTRINFNTTPIGSTTTALAMRITDAGEVGIGIASPTHILHINGQGRATNSAWATTSDIRLKDINGTYDLGLDEILQINTVKFSYKKDNPLGLPSDKEFTGIVAQELQKVIPEAVEETKDGYLTVNSDPVHWAVVNAIKDLYNKYIVPILAKNTEQDRKLASLAEENARIKAQNEKLSKENEKIQKRLEAIEKMLQEK